jgi:peptidyl-prolyl cis-trans isomerase SurA
MPTPNRLPCIVAMIAAAAGPLGLPKAGAAADAAAEVVARVGGDTISRDQLAAALERAQATAIPEGPQRRQAEAAVLEQLVNDLLLRQAAARAGVVVDPAAVAAQVERIKKDIATRGATFEEFLARIGRDEAGLRQQIAAELVIRQFLASRVTPDVVAAHFENNRREFDGTLVRVSHIVLRPDIGRGEQAVNECLDRAKEIRSRILQGELTFAEAARIHSAGPSRRREGDVGFIPRRGVAHEEFGRQAFALAKGDVSQPFATPSGIHLLRVTDNRPGQLTLARLRPQLEQALVDVAVRDTLAEGHRTTAIEVAPGIVHFDPATPSDGAAPRRVIGGPDGD